jgi:autotransporter-associated beta strand protein
VGYTENAGLASPQQFVNMFNTGVATGVIGFDSSDPVGNPQTISGNIDLGAFSSESTPFLGTSTVITLSGSILPSNNSYSFTGVKGGNLTVTSDLNFGGAFLVVGLPTPIENNGSISTVTLEGDNSGVSSATFNSGQLFINSDTALGIGAVAVPDPTAVLASPTLSPFGGTVTLANDISFGTVNPNSNPLPGLTVGNASTSDLLVLNGVLSDYDVAQPGGVGYLGIIGSVALNNANTYTGGTIFTGSGNGIAYVGNSAAFGTGLITVQQPGVISPNTSGVSLANAINLESTLTLGNNGNPNLLTLTGDITGYSGLEILSDVSLTGTNVYTGSTFVQDANLAIGSSTTLGTGPLQLSGATLSYGFTNPTVLDLSGDSGSTLTLAPSSTLTLDTDNNEGPEVSFGGTINGDASTSVVKVDVGTELLTGTSPYGGGTSVNAGTLIAGSPGALGTGPVSVASGANLGVDSGTTLTLPISLSGGATLSGRGTFAPASPFTFAGGTTVVAGNAINGQYISTLTLGNSVTFGISGIYGFNVADAMGSAGTGYSTLAITGPLTISATPGLPFSIQLTSIDPSSGNPGMAMNFNSATPYTWTLLTASSISGFAANDFSVNTAHFQNTFAPGFFQVGQSGNTLTLDFTPVPEPSTWMLLGTGLAAVGAGLRRRKRV